MWAWLLRIFRPIAQWVVPLLFEFLFVKIKSAVSDWKKRKEEAKSSKEASDQYKQVVDDPNATREERKDAEDEFINK